MKTKKLLSILLALMMMLSVVPMYASAADPIALTASNITTFPTVSGTIYYGQTVDEALTLIGGEVQYNGSVVSGEFVHTDPAFRPLGAGANRTTRTSFTFVPTDSTTYSDIAVRNSRDVTYIVLPTVPVLVSEDDKPVVTTEVEAGTALSEITISGGKVQNPYYAEESTYLSQTWTWVEPSTPVDKSGYYKAKIAGDDKKYSDFILDVYVEVVGSTIVPEIEKNPLELEFENGRTWSNVNLDCCEAFVSNEDGTTSKISGSFSVTDYWKELGVLVGSHQVDVIFTPDDIETYATVEFKLSIMVKPMPIAFIDSEGNAVVEGFEFEVEPGTKMGDVRALLNAVLRVPANSIIQVEDSNSYAQNGRTYKLTVLYDENTNYTGNELYFTVRFKNVEVAPKFKPGYLKSSIDCGDYKPTGTFTVSLDGKEIATVKNLEEFAYSVENSGDYVLSAKYNPAENDYFIIADFETTVNVKLKRVLTLVNTTTGTTTYYPGDQVQIVANIPEFSGWKVIDANGNEVTVEGVDNTSEVITITMPDYDITVEALGSSSSGSTGNGIDGILGGLDMDELTQGDSEWAIINIIRNLIAKFKSFLQELIETFQSIGD